MLLLLTLFIVKVPNFWVIIVYNRNQMLQISSLANANIWINIKGGENFGNYQSDFAPSVQRFQQFSNKLRLSTLF